MPEPRHWKVVSIEDVAAIDWRRTGLQWRPIRPELGADFVGLAAFTADAGELVVEPHTESIDGRGQQELYFVIRGRARFVVDGEDLELSPGMILRVDPSAHRQATASEDDTAVLAFGGDAVYEPSASEWIERARPHIHSAPSLASEIIDDLKAALPGDRAGQVGDALLALGRGDESVARGIVASLIVERPQIRGVLESDPDLGPLLPN